MALGRGHATCAPDGALDRRERAEAVTIEALHERYLADLFRYVLQRVPRIEEAEDITAEVFAAAAAGLGRYRGGCPPYLWLLSIARRKIVDARRRRATRRETLASELAAEGPEAVALWEAVAAVEGPEAALLRAEARRELAALVARLGADQREALLLQTMERLSVAEIAVVMRRTPASVAGLLKRARASLKRWGRETSGADREGDPR
jgi:RNA polymerase sigma-70 factor (ECF subfamily)